VVEVAGPPPQKIFFCLQNDKFGCTLTQFLSGRKHGQSIEALEDGLYGSVAKHGQSLEALEDGLYGSVAKQSLQK